MTERMNTTRRSCLALAAALPIAGLAGGAHAWAVRSPVDLQIVDRETGRVLPVWRHDGRMFVAGRTGARYGLRVANHTGRRVLVVMSVDGVNVLTGETAGWDQRGYIFDPGDSYDVTGWRKSNTEVAAFTFAALSQSYAARTGRPGEVGVIGIAVFDERIEAPPPPPPPPPPEASAGGDFMGRVRGAPADAARQAAPAPPSATTVTEEVVTAERKAAAAARDERLGTAHGAREWSEVRIEPFERATAYPQFTQEIEYDSYAHLVAAGVIPAYGEPLPHPRPFPESPDSGPYVPDPPGGDP